MLFVRRPYHLSEHEADRWMRSQAAALAAARPVKSVELSRLQSPAAPSGGDWDWLIEMHLSRAEDALHAAREPVCRDLLGDLRLLGMNPSLLLVDGTRPLEG